MPRAIRIAFVNPRVHHTSRISYHEDMLRELEDRPYSMSGLAAAAYHGACIRYHRLVLPPKTYETPRSEGGE